VTDTLIRLVAATAAVALIAVGLWLYTPALAYIWVGAAVLVTAIWLPTLDTLRKGDR
jgi:ABC-type bacteriocin/lantibiotic exporter with double-glycine peptidase domain